VGLCSVGLRTKGSYKNLVRTKGSYKNLMRTKGSYKNLMETMEVDENKRIDAL
jgi:hypothetical protein